MSIPGFPHFVASTLLLMQAASLPAGVVVGVKDGDTLFARIGGHVLEVRLAGIDAPEKQQPYGLTARQELHRLVCGGALSLEVSGLSYGRPVARVTNDGIDVERLMLEAGLAWHATGYSSNPSYAAAEHEARRAKRGLWSAREPLPPWVWRRKNRGASVAPLLCRAAADELTRAAYRGNINSKVLHARGCRDFECSNCLEAFETPQVAVAAGFRPHRECLRSVTVPR